VKFHTVVIGTAVGANYSVVRIYLSADSVGIGVVLRRLYGAFTCGVICGLIGLIGLTGLRWRLAS
jgi:hypothetical protein